MTVLVTTKLAKAGGISVGCMLPYERDLTRSTDQKHDAAVEASYEIQGTTYILNPLLVLMDYEARRLQMIHYVPSHAVGPCSTLTHVSTKRLERGDQIGPWAGPLSFQLDLRHSMGQSSKGSYRSVGVLPSGPCKTMGPLSSNPGLGGALRVAVPGTSAVLDQLHPLRTLSHMCESCRAARRPDWLWLASLNSSLRHRNWLTGCGLELSPLPASDHAWGLCMYVGVDKGFVTWWMLFEYFRSKTRDEFHILM
ncbi:hypothetical protein F5Y05DRAFT_302166 [Hypoxylon sp. FL0543]|nr:hypothetical protein F5Y05DRAFT_302166 [Hypoxylon sp. FL0543]